MATVIQNSALSKHSVDKYNFKVIALGSNEDNEEIQTQTLPSEPKIEAGDSEIDSSALSSSSKESLIESLMKKTDEMSSNFIKLQMKLESKEEEYKLSLQKATEKAFAEGMEAGKAKAMEAEEQSVSKSLEQFASSVKTLEESAKVFEGSLEAVKNELIFAALDISKEVIKVELSENSSEVAKLLSDELIKDLQSASKITLKVNPKDHGNISVHLGKLKYIDIVSDSAVSPGGVIILSDAGNIDAQISKRFERVKKAALSE